MKNRYLIAPLLMLGGCQAYAPVPLSTTPDVLAAPDAAAIAKAASAIDRPYLKPAAIDLAAPLDGNAIATLAVIANPDLKALRARAGIGDAQISPRGYYPTRRSVWARARC